MPDNYLTEEERRLVARKIDAVMGNIQYPGEHDWRRFTVLMYELYQKKFVLHANTRDITQYCEKPFPEDVIDEMEIRMQCVADLLFGIPERRETGRGDFLPDFG